MDKKFKELILGFIIELNLRYDYKISINKVLQIFKLCGQYDFFNEDEFKNCLQSILCNNYSQYENFYNIFNNYFCDFKNMGKYNYENMLKNNEIEQLNNEYQAQQKILENEKNIIKDYDGDNFYEENKELIDLIIKETNTDDNIINLINLNEQFIFNLLKETGTSKITLLESNLEKMLIYSIENNLDEKISDRILKSASLISETYKKYEDIIKKEKTVLSISKEIKKIESKNHRQLYVSGKNAVQTERGYIYKDITKLDDKDLVYINRYIKQNANKFKLSISKKLKSSKNKIFDYNKVIKNSVKTDMVPIELFYKKPAKNKIKIICILDISGSCKNASQILMSFVYSLQEIFTGGVESYVFVKHLNKITDILKNYSIEKVNEMVSTRVERDYSDYNTAFKEFDKKYFSCITKDSIVIYLGDARNNNNEDGAKYLDKIKTKLKSGKGKMFWINPEPLNRWNQGDSIISTYEKFMDKVIQVKNASDLITFFDNILN